MSETHALPSQDVPSFVRALNPLIRRLIGAGLPFGPNVLLTVRGRSSGQLHTFPVALIEIDGRRYVQSPFGEVNWVRNLRAAGEAVIGKGERAQSVVAVELTADEAAPVLRRAIAPYMRHRLLRAVLGRYFAFGPDASPAEFVADAEHHPMFELRTRG